MIVTLFNVSNAQTSSALPVFNCSDPDASFTAGPEHYYWLRSNARPADHEAACAQAGGRMAYAYTADDYVFMVGLASKQGRCSGLCTIDNFHSRYDLSRCSRYKDLRIIRLLGKFWPKDHIPIEGPIPMVEPTPRVDLKLYP